MSQIVVLGAGISGHTAASFLRKWLDRGDEVVVVSPEPDYNWIPSNIWVGVGLMPPSKVLVPLAPLYERHRIVFKQAKAVAIHPEGSAKSPNPFVEIEWTLGARAG
ncbi:MAG: NAD(P)/FAD-dependent oxidoreductase, partial [Acidobacteria bacterium]|nr:NAD(P)/FAD-dependent oxidoreductase [Acidobacteriota bacterium]